MRLASTAFRTALDDSRSDSAQSQRVVPRQPRAACGDGREIILADLYRCRWEIEVFFKQIKQTLQLADFLGHNANAVRWQVWMALLVYVLLRYLSYLSRWAHSFTRLFTSLRAVLWE